MIENEQINITKTFAIAVSEVELNPIRAQGAGGQNVNKVSSAIHLRFDIPSSSLPDFVKTRLLESKDRRVNKEGVLVLKAQQFRTQEKNRDDALARLKEFISPAFQRKTPRLATKPSRSASRRRMDTKTKRGQIKSLRGRVPSDSD